MSIRYGNSSNCFCDIFSSLLLIIIVFTSIYLFPCGAYNVSKNRSVDNGLNVFKFNSSLTKSEYLPRLFKRSSGKWCSNTTECSTELRGSVCVHNTCVCLQGYLPNNKKGTVGCFQVGDKLGSFCNASVHCGEELVCRNHVCFCPDGFQLFHTQGMNMCLLWHNPTRLDRCRTTDDCMHQDPNTVCKKRWCQCNNGYQLFETMLLGRKQKCFKTFRIQCINSSQCAKHPETTDQYCICYYGVCHCIADINSTSFDIPIWTNGNPNWYQRWKKALILATRLLFITVILFFVPCFIYVTLGMRERSRLLFSQFVPPSRSPVVHYSQRRTDHLRPLRSYRGVSDGSATLGSSDSHRVDMSLHLNGINSHVDSRPRSLSHPQGCEASGVNSRLIDTRPRSLSHPPQNSRMSRDYSCGLDFEHDFKEEDPPPSYETIMRNEAIPEAPPPPYREL